MDIASSQALGAYLKDRRGRLDPASLGFAATRRRTPGLRREEVALRASISPAWYTWLEQGRGGAPSTEVLDRLARALMLTEVEREHLYLLGVGHPPDLRYQPAPGVTPRLQRVLDRLVPSPAIVRSVTWDVVAWNRAAEVVFMDYAALPPAERNMLRILFLRPEARQKQQDWDQIARFVLGVFRADAARAGASAAVQPLVDELCAASTEFAELWQNHDVRGFGEGIKRIQHAELGTLALEFSAFAVDGRPDLSMLVYEPATAEDEARIRAAL